MPMYGKFLGIGPSKCSVWVGNIHDPWKNDVDVDVDVDVGNFQIERITNFWYCWWLKSCITSDEHDHMICIELKAISNEVHDFFQHESKTNSF